MRFLCILILLLSAGRLHAQDGKTLRFEKVHGLSQNTVYSIMQDKQGFMWIATADGLNRFDGQKMIVFKPSPLSEKGEMAGRIIRSKILEDNQSNLWFSTEVGLFRFDKRNRNFTLIPLKNNLNGRKSISVNPVFISAGILWTVNHGVGVINYEIATGRYNNYSLLDSNGSPISTLQEGACYGGGKLYVGGPNGLFQFDIHTLKWLNLNHSKDITCTAFQNDTLYWNEGTAVFFRDTHSGRQGEVPINLSQKGGLIKCMHLDKNGNLYFGDDSGNIFVKYAGVQSFILMGNINANKDAKPVYPALSIFVNRSGVLFAGGDVAGLQKVDLFRPNFNNYPSNANDQIAKDLFVTSIAEDEGGNIIIGSYQGGLHWKKKGSNYFLPLLQGKPKPEKKQNEQTSMVHRDFADNFWLCYGNELFLYERGQTGYRKIIPQNKAVVGNQALQVYCITPIKNGWYLGTNIGLIKIEKSGMEYGSIRISAMGQTNIKSLWQESEARLWLGFESGGVLIVNPENNFKTEQSFLEGAGIKSFSYDSTHSLMYISTMSGLVAYHIPSGDMKIFSEKDGLRNSYIYGVIPGKNELWVSTNRGLSRVDIQFKEGKTIPEASFTNFTSKDGLPDDEFNTGAFYKAKDGIFYFGTIKGLTWFNPDDLKPNQRIPDIAFTDVHSNKRNADSGIAAEYIEQLVLPYSGNEMQFTFQALEYANPEVVEYAYQMAGWDKNWVYSQQLNEVRYANLSPGKYVFKVKARKSSGIWGPEKTMSINIEPPFYRTQWFYTLVILSVIGCIVWATRYMAQRKLKTKIEELEKQKALYQERLRISREMHDDIGAGLTQIVLMSESVKNNVKDGNNKELKDIAETSRQLVNNMGEIIWSLNPGNKTLDQIMAHLREQLYQQLEYAGVNYHIELPENGKEIALSNEKRRNILLITKEIVNNAIKHSKAKNISVIAVLSNNQLTFSITDDGIGFDIEQVQKGNGLKNINQRIKDVGGKIVFEPLKTGGVCFTYHISLVPTT